MLARAGLVRSRREGTRVFYRLASDRVAELWAAVRDVAAQHVAEVTVLAEDYLGRATSSSSRRRSSRRGCARGTWSCSTCGRSRSTGPGTSPAPSRSRSRRLASFEPPRRREVVAYCRGPYCVYADDAVRLLRERGVDARRLDVGFPEWRRAGLPVETTS